MSGKTYANYSSKDILGIKIGESLISVTYIRATNKKVSSVMKVKVTPPSDQVKRMDIKQDRTMRG